MMRTLKNHNRVLYTEEGYCFRAFDGTIALYISILGDEDHGTLVNFLLENNFRIEKISYTEWFKYFLWYYDELNDAGRKIYRGSVLRIERNLDIIILDKWIKHLKTKNTGKSWMR